MAAGAAQPQMHPLRPELQAFLATEGARRDITNFRGMLTFVGHQTLRWLLSAGALAVSARQTCRVATTCTPSPTAAATRLIDHEDHQNEGQVNASHVQTRARKRDCVIGLIWVSDRITCRGPSVSRALARCDGLG